MGFVRPTAQTRSTCKSGTHGHEASLDDAIEDRHPLAGRTGADSAQLGAFGITVALLARLPLRGIVFVAKILDRDNVRR